MGVVVTAKLKGSLSKKFEKGKKKFMKRIAKRLAKEYRKALKSKGAVASGALYSSIAPNWTDDKAFVTGNFYGRFVDKGTRPFKPPMSRLVGWSRKKVGADWLAARASLSIQQKGIRPRGISELAAKRVIKNAKHDFKISLR